MAKTFDKAAWLEEKSAKLDAAKTALENGLKALETSEDWKATLRGIAQLGALSVLRYSFTNNILIQLSRPGTTKAATYKAWQDSNRQVRAGEKGILILQPVFKRKPASSSAGGDASPPSDDGERARDPRGLAGFKPLTVFALEQTEGEALPAVTLPDVLGDEVFDQSVETLREVALGISGSPVSEIQVRPREHGDHPSALGWYSRLTKQIVVINEGPRARQFATLCHELAHALLHPMGDHHTTPEREVEAESTAFVVCHALGLDTGHFSFPYVSAWAKSEKPLDVIARRGQRIAGAARTILDALVPPEVDAVEPEVALAA